MILTFQEGVRQYANVADIFPWSDNPRDLTDEAFKNLKEKLKLGEAESLLVTEEGMVINGNRRRDAYIVIGKTKAWVCIVRFEQETQEDGTVVYRPYLDSIKAERTFHSVDQAYLEYALALNISDGRFNSEKLAELALPHQYHMPMEIYKVPLAHPVKLQSILDSVQPTPHIPEPSIGDPTELNISEENVNEPEENTKENTEDYILVFDNKVYEEVVKRVEVIGNPNNLTHEEVFLKLLTFYEEHKNLDNISPQEEISENTSEETNETPENL